MNMKFFKIAAFWVATLVTTIVLVWLSSLGGLDSVAKILITSLYGHCFMLVTGFLLAFFAGKGISTSVWWSICLHLLTSYYLNERDILLITGPILGMVLSFWLLRKSEEILDGQEVAKA